MLERAGAWGYGVQIFMTLGLERARAAKAMTMAYSSIVWSELAGVFLFSEVPNTWAVLGVLVIVGSTLYNSSQARIQHSVARTFFPDSVGQGRSEAENEAILLLERGPSLSRSPSHPASVDATPPGALGSGSEIDGALRT